MRKAAVFLIWMLHSSLIFGGDGTIALSFSCPKLPLLIPFSFFNHEQEPDDTDINKDSNICSSETESVYQPKKFNDFEYFAKNKDEYEDEYEDDYEDENETVCASCKKRQLLLHAAVKKGDMNVIKFLIRHDRKSVHETDEDGRTPLFLAAKHGRLKVVKTLLTLNAAVNHRDTIGRTALFLAVECGHPDVVRYLVVTGGAEVNLTDKNGVPLLSLSDPNRDADMSAFLIKSSNLQSGGSDCMAWSGYL